MTSNLKQTNYDILVANKGLEKRYLATDGRVKVDGIFGIDKKPVRLNIIGRTSKPALALSSRLSARACTSP